MIRLAKGDEPKVLVDNGALWTEELLAEIQAGGDKIAYRKGKYNQPQIKEAIKEETFRKCAYCESRPLHVTHGDIEHIVPKSVQPELTFDWANLTLACDVCNTKKSNREGLVDPYNCDPEQEFSYHGPMVLHNEGRGAAELTRTVLDLNRIDLLNKRKDRIDALANLFRRIEQNDNEQERAMIIKATVEHESDQSSEYAACARSFLRSMGYAV